VARGAAGAAADLAAAAAAAQLATAPASQGSSAKAQARPRARRLRTRRQGLSPASAAAATVWLGPDGREPTPPPEAWTEWEDPSPPPNHTTAPRLPSPPPADADTFRTDLLALVGAVAAHAVAPPSGALWAPPRRGRSRSALAADALAAPAVTPGSPPNQEQANGHAGGALPASLRWRQLLSAPEGATQRELSAPSHTARRARLYAGLSGWARTGLAAVQGGGAGPWLSAVPSDRGGRGTIPGFALRVAARLWLCVPPRPQPPRSRCSRGATVDPAGRHFLATCSAQVARLTAVHYHVVGLVAAALRRAPPWGDVVVERHLYGSDGARRPDLRATESVTAAVTWGDVSMPWPWPDQVAPQVRAAPLRAVAAAAREATKRATFVPALPTSDAPHVFTPLFWEALGRIGPATAAWLRAAVAGPQLAAVRAGLLLDVCVALWRSLTWAVAGGYAACSTPDDGEDAPADNTLATADALAWSGGQICVPHYLRGNPRRHAASSPFDCQIGE